MKVKPAPIVAPISAAVRRSYSFSCPPSSSGTRTDTRGCWERLRGRLGIAVVAITFLLSQHVVGRLGRIELVRRKVHPTATPKRLRAPLNSPNRRRRRDEQVLGLLADDREQRVEVAELLLGQRHGVLDPLVCIVQRRVDLVDVAPYRGGNEVDVFAHPAGVANDSRDVVVGPLEQLVDASLDLPKLDRDRNRDEDQRRRRRGR